MTDRRRIIGHAILLFVLLSLVSWWLNASLSFFISDTGLRFIQVRELIDNQWQTLAVSYPGRIFDPELVHLPYYYAYSILRDEIYLNIPPFVPLLASWGYVAAGVPGLMLVPVLGGILTAVAIYKIAVLTRLPKPLSLLWLSIFATPLFFYSLELWDHSLAAACATWGVYFVAKGLVNQTRQNWILGGLVTGLGLGQRPEIFLFALSLGGALLIVNWPRWKPAFWLIIGGIGGALPIWLLQYNWVGHPLGMAMAPILFGYGRPAAPTVTSGNLPRVLKTGRLLFYIEGRDMLTFTATIAIILGILIIFLTFRVEKWQKRWLLWAGFIFTCIGALAFTLKAFQPTSLNGILSTFPLFALAVVYAGNTVDTNSRRIVYRFTFLVTFLFFAVMLLLWPASGGRQWGTRYILPVFPLGIFLAFYTFSAYSSYWSGKNRRDFRYLFTVLVGITMLLQAAGFYAQISIHRLNESGRDGVTALPVDIIITNSKYLPSESASVADKIFLYADSEEKVAHLIARFWEQDIRQFAVVPLHFVPLPVPETGDGFTVREVQPFVYELGQQ